jgi:hypothetical protein
MEHQPMELYAILIWLPLVQPEEEAGKMVGMLNLMIQVNCN